MRIFVAHAAGLGPVQASRMHNRDVALDGILGQEGEYECLNKHPCTNQIRQRR